MNEVLETLKERGFMKQCTDIEALSKLLDEKKVTMYAGFDPTGKSLHIGHMVPIFALKHIAQAGHKVIILIGGGSGKSATRQEKLKCAKFWITHKLTKTSN